MFLLMAITAMPFTACSNDEEPKTDNETTTEEEDLHNAESDEDQTEIKAFDALEWLQGAVYGNAFDESQPTVLSVEVDDLAGAEEIFLGWVAPGKEATKVEGGYDYALTDAEGKSQGSVSFRAVAGEAGVVARMTLSGVADCENVSEVSFIQADSWPLNDTTPVYEAGKIYPIADEVWQWVSGEHYGDVRVGVVSDYKMLDFYCIQGNDNGKEAILVWLSPDKNDISYHPEPKLYLNHNRDYVDYFVYTQLPTVAQAQKVLECYNANPDAWKAMLKEMDAKGYQWSANIGWLSTGNSEFLLNSYNEKTNQIKCLDLDGKPGKICNVAGNSWFRYRYMHVYIFPPATK